MWWWNAIFLYFPHSNNRRYPLKMNRDVNNWCDNDDNSLRPLTVNSLLTFLFDKKDISSTVWEIKTFLVSIEMQLFHSTKNCCRFICSQICFDVKTCAVRVSKEITGQMLTIEESNQAIIYNNSNSQASNWVKFDSLKRLLCVQHYSFGKAL